MLSTAAPPILAFDADRDKLLSGANERGVARAAAKANVADPPGGAGTPFTAATGDVNADVPVPRNALADPDGVNAPLPDRGKAPATGLSKLAGAGKELLLVGERTLPAPKLRLAAGGGRGAGETGEARPPGLVRLIGRGGAASSGDNGVAE